MNTKYPVKVIVNGFKGKMGQMLFACAPKFPSVEIVGGWDDGVSTVPVVHYDQADVIIDFSVHHITPDLVRRCAGYGRAVVIGTTGHTPEEAQIIKSFSAVIPIVFATNFSLGANILFWLAHQAATRLGPDFDLEILEMHHRMKKDSPSGTAATLADILVKARNEHFEEKVHPRQRGAAAVAYGRPKGQTDIRDSSQVCVHSLRGGDVFGDHTVIFAGDGERVELTHRASSREAFANGALLAALWVNGKAPGMYNMADVLGLTGLK